MAGTSPEASDEAALVRRTLAGDRAAFAKLYRRRCRLIVAVCYDATGDLHAAADLCQEVFLRAFRRLPSLQDPARFGTWLLGIAGHAAREWRRAAGRRRAHLDRFARAQEQALQHGVSLPDPGVRRLRDAIAMLPEDERLAVHSFYLEGRDAEAAAALLSISRATLYRMLARARERLRELLRTLEVLR